MKNDKIVAFYSTKDQAERARDELIDAGFDRDDCRIFTGEGPSVWQDMKEAFGFADEEDRYLYVEAARRGGVALLVDFDDEDSPSSQTALRILQKHGPMDLTGQAVEWRKQGWAGYQKTTEQGAVAAQATTTGHTTAHTTHREGEQVLPVVEERLAVGKRAVERGGGVRVYTKVTERPVQEQVNLRQERVTVERRPADRPAGAGDEAFREKTVEVTERREEPVVSKQARVIEEVVVGKHVENRTETVRDTVRRTDVEIEKLNPDDDRGRAFADEFAAELYRDQRYAGRDWVTIEPDARRTFEQRYPGGKWEQFKDSISRGYQRLKAKV